MSRFFVRDIWIFGKRVLSINPDITRLNENLDISPLRWLDRGIKLKKEVEKLPSWIK